MSESDLTMRRINVFFPSGKDISVYGPTAGLIVCDQQIGFIKEGILRREKQLKESGANPLPGRDSQPG